MPASRSLIGTPTRCGSSGPGAGQRHQAALALGDLVVAGPAALGPVVAEAADRQGDQPRVELGQHVGAEAEPVQRAGAEVLHQHVGPPQQLGEHRLVAVVLEVEGDRLLVPVGGEEVGRLPARPSGVSTNGGPQPRLSSPLPGLSTLITRAPRSPSIIAACGPARARVRSTTSTPSRGPLTGCLSFTAAGRRTAIRGRRPLAGQTTVSVTHRSRLPAPRRRSTTASHGARSWPARLPA